MATKKKTVELACQGPHGEWDHLGDYATEEEAIQGALQWAAGDARRDDFGTAVFGISTDPGSGHYETRVEVYEDGTHTVQ